MQNFRDIKVRKAWGFETEVFNNGVVSCWHLRINRGQETSLHMHESKDTAMILLNGRAHVQLLNASYPIAALDKGRFSRGFFHRHKAITDCDLLEVESPINKLDVYRFKDSYGRAGQPYESGESFEAITDLDPQFIGGSMGVGKANLRVFEFLNAKAFVSWARKLPRSCVVITRGSLVSPEGVPVVKAGHIVWSNNLADLLCDTWPDGNMQAILVTREGEAKI